MNRVRAWMLALVLGTGASGGIGLAWGGPATPSYLKVEESIGAVRAAWENPQGDDLRRAEGWNAFVTVLEEALGTYTSAPNSESRERALSRLSRLSDALRVSGWAPARQLQSALDEWLAPRLNLLNASQQLKGAIQALPPAPNPDVEENREKWIQFDDRLADSLRDYEAAGTVTDRIDALDRLRRELDRLRTSRQNAAWAPAAALHGALAQLFELPNVEATADLSIVTPVLSQQVVFNDVIYRMGQYSYVTPGPRTGFSLLPNDYGISFYNSQIAYSYTPVQGFTEQMKQQDPRGERVARLYQFDAQTYNTSEARVFTTISTQGISLNPISVNNVDAAITSRKQPGFGPHVGRSVASLIGFNQRRITQEVYQGAIPEIRQQAEIGAREEAAEKSGAAQAQLNAQAARYLIGYNTIALGDLALTNTALSSRPTFIYAQGTLQYRGAPGQLGADFPQPPEFAIPTSGLTADVHLTSTLSNVTRGFYQKPEVQNVENLMITLGAPVEGSTEPESLATAENVDFKTYLEAVQESRANGNTGTQVIRVIRPERAPEFAADRDGNLAVYLRNLVIEVPAPPQAAQGGLGGPAAQVYRITIPKAVVTISLTIEPPVPGGPIAVRGTVISLDTGQGTSILAINGPDDEGQRLNAITSTIALGVVRSRVANRPIEFDLDPPNLQGLAIQSVSALHPSGWIRAVLYRAW